MEIQLSQILMQLINFGVLLFVLTKFLYKPILKILDQRADRIDKGLLAAQQNLEAKEQIEQFKKEAQIKAEKQAQKVIDEAKVEAKKIGDEMIAKAKLDAQAAAAKEESAAKARLLEEEKAMTRRLSDLIVMTTKSLLKDALKQEHQQEIINYQISNLSKLKN